MLPRAATLAASQSPRWALATVIFVVFIGLLAASYSLMQFGFAPYLGRLYVLAVAAPFLLGATLTVTVRAAMPRVGASVQRRRAMR